MYSIITSLISLLSMFYKYSLSCTIMTSPFMFLLRIIYWSWKSELQREGGKTPSAGSPPRWLQHPALGQAGTMAKIFIHGPSYFAFPKLLAGSWAGSKAAGTWTRTNTGYWHHRWWFLPCATILAPHHSCFKHTNIYMNWRIQWQTSMHTLAQEKIVALSQHFVIHYFWKA